MVAGLDFVTTGQRMSAQAPAQRIDPAADRILREMGEYLAAAEQFMVRADVSMDTVLRSGQW